MFYDNIFFSFTQAIRKSIFEWANNQEINIACIFRLYDQFWKGPIPRFFFFIIILAVLCVQKMKNDVMTYLFYVVSIFCLSLFCQ